MAFWGFGEGVDGGKGSFTASLISRSSCCLALRLEVDHQRQAVFSIADENLAETYRSDRPQAAIKMDTDDPLSLHQFFDS